MFFKKLAYLELDKNLSDLIQFALNFLIESNIVSSYPNSTLQQMQISNEEVLPSSPHGK